MYSESSCIKSQLFMVHEGVTLTGLIYKTFDCGTLFGVICGNMFYAKTVRNEVRE